MGFVGTIVSRCKCNHTKSLFLRLYGRQYCTIARSRTLPAGGHKNLLGKYKFVTPSYRWAGVAGNSTQTIDLSQTDKHQHEPEPEPEFEPEHMVIHSILANSIYYTDSILPPIRAAANISSEEIDQLYDTDWSTVSAQSTFSALKKVTYYHLNGQHVESSLCSFISNGIACNLSELHEQQIMVVMQCLIVLRNSIHLRDYHYCMKALNKECLQRFFCGNASKLLLICDAFYQLRCQNSDYMWRALRKLSGKVSSLRPKHLVQLMFLLNLAHIKTTVNMYEIECHFEECIDELTGDEVGIIARGFFLQKRGMRNKTLIPKVLDKVEKSIRNMDSRSLAAIMKILRYSDSVHCTDQFIRMLIPMRELVDRLSLISLTHVAQAVASLRVYDKILMDNIFERFKQNAQFARVKDIERIIYSISAVAPPTSYYNDLCHALINDVLLNYRTRRSAEIQQYPESLARTLAFLTIQNVYIPELIEFTLNPEFVKTMHTNNIKFVTNELLVLECSLKIDLPSYKGPFLDRHLYRYLIKKHSFTDDTYRKDSAVQLRTEIVYLLKEKFNVNTCIDYILPHTACRDIIFGMDEDNNVINVEPILSAMPAGSIKSVNNEELRKIKWKVIVLLPQMVKVIGHGGYTGPVYQKFRQLRTIGYTPIPICECKWRTYSEEHMKVAILKQLIYEESNNDL